MDIKYIYITGLIFIILPASVQSQNLSSSIKDDMKKELMKQIKPSLNLSNPSMQQSPMGANRAVQSDDLLEFYRKYKSGSGGAEFDDKYRVNPRAITYSSEIPINKLPDGYVVPVYTGGHFIFANPNTNINGLVTPSGMDLSGSKKKKLSAKSKAILENVFSIKVEE